MRLKTRLFLAFFLFAFLPVAGLSYLSLELGIGSLERIASPGIEEALLDAHALADGTLEAYAGKTLELTPASPIYASAEQYLAHGLDIAVLVTGEDTTSAGEGDLSPDFIRSRLLALGETSPTDSPLSGSRSGWMSIEERVLAYALRWSQTHLLVTGCWLPVDQGRLLEELAFHLQRFEELKLWPRLIAFLDDPRIPLDNNAAERALRGVVLGRKNHYGSRSKRGTEVAALFYSLLESAKLCRVEPKAYLREAAYAALKKPGTVTLPSDLMS